MSLLRKRNRRKKPATTRRFTLPTQWPRCRRPVGVSPVRMRGFALIQPSIEKSSRFAALKAACAATGAIRPVIDSTYALADIVDAHRYVDIGHKRGNVILTVP